MGLIEVSMLSTGFDAMQGGKARLDASKSCANRLGQRMARR